MIRKKVYAIVLLPSSCVSQASDISTQSVAVLAKEAKQAGKRSSRKKARLVETEDKIRKGAAQGRWKLCGCEACYIPMKMKDPNSKL